MIWFDLLKRRKTAGLSQVELAERAGVGIATVQRLEQGRASNIRAQTLRAIAAALGCDPEALAADYHRFLSEQAQDKASPAA